MTTKKEKKNLSEDEIEALLKKGWSTLQTAFDDLIKGCSDQGMDLVVESLTLTKKIASIYERAHMSSFYASKGLKQTKKEDKNE